MTSETKVPMPEPPKIHPLLFGSDRKWTDADVLNYGDARASERDAFWMAKVAELERKAARYDWLRNDMATEFGEPWAITRYAPGDERNSDGGTCPLIGDELDSAIDACLATLTNPRAGETA